MLIRQASDDSLSLESLKSLNDVFLLYPLGNQDSFLRKRRRSAAEPKIQTPSSKPQLSTNLMTVRPPAPPSSLETVIVSDPFSGSLYRQLQFKWFRVVTWTDFSIQCWFLILRISASQGCLLTPWCCVVASQMNVWYVFSLAGSFNDCLTPVIPTAHKAQTDFSFFFFFFYQVVQWTKPTSLFNLWYQDYVAKNDAWFLLPYFFLPQR